MLVCARPLKKRDLERRTCGPIDERRNRGRPIGVRGWPRWVGSHSVHKLNFWVRLKQPEAVRTAVARTPDPWLAGRLQQHGVGGESDQTYPRPRIEPASEPGAATAMGASASEPARGHAGIHQPGRLFQRQVH